MKALLAEVRVLQPDGGDDQKDGEDDHEEVEDEDAGEGRGQLVHHPREAKMSSWSLGKHSKKNYGIIWEFFPNVGPPPFGNPSFKKKSCVYFAF